LVGVDVFVKQFILCVFIHLALNPLFIIGYTNRSKDADNIVNGAAQRSMVVPHLYFEWFSSIPIHWWVFSSCDSRLNLLLLTTMTNYTERESHVLVFLDYCDLVKHLCLDMRWDDSPQRLVITLWGLCLCFCSITVYLVEIEYLSKIL